MRFSSAKLRSFGAKNARSTQGTRAESKIMPRALCGMRLRLLRSFCRRWARVVRRKCVEIHRNLRDFERKSWKFSAKCAAHNTAELRETFASCSACMQQLFGCSICVLRASAAAIALTFKNFNAKIARFFVGKIAQFRRQKRAQNTRNAHKIKNHASCTVRHAPATSAQFLQALGTCRAQKVR